MEINSRTIREHQEMKEIYEEFAGKCDIIMSTPGTFFLAGEKAIVHKAPATCMKIPRRVYVGLKKQNNSTLASIHWENSTVMVQKSEKLPFKTSKWDRKYPNFINALVAASVAYHAVTGTNLSTSYQLHILSEWGSGSGLGWSGAFSAALAGALLMSEDKIGDPKKWPTDDPVQLASHPEFYTVMQLGWCIESVLHGGRASGSAVCGSLLGTGLPYFYGISGDPKENMPSLRMLGLDQKEKNKLCKDPSTYGPLIEKGKYWFDYASARADHSPLASFESRIHKQLFKIRDIMIVNSGVPKRTADAAKREHDPDHWFNKNIKKEEDYQPLVRICKYTGEITKELMNTLRDGDSSTLDNQWDILCQLMTRCQGLLTFLGFNYPIGDEILGVMISEICDTLIEVSDKEGVKSIGGKLTGGGGGGSLIFVTRTKTEERLHFMEKVIAKLRDKYTERPQSLAQIYILYSAHRDDIESKGLVYEESMLEKKAKPDNESRKENVEKLIANYERRLQKLREQQALEGISIDPKIPIEIEDIEAKVAQLQMELKVLE